MRTALPLYPRHRQRGVGLIEILITIILLSIGFLAAARMQVEGMRFSQSAYYQSQAYFLASDMMNRMRTNVEGVRDGFYDNIQTSASAQDPGCTASACDPQEIALQDVFEWGGYFHERNGEVNFIPALPSSDNVTAFATVVPVDADIYTVRMVWSEIIGGEDKAQELSVNFALGRVEEQP